jgi:hypothetical protein
MEEGDGKKEDPEDYFFSNKSNKRKEVDRNY